MRINSGELLFSASDLLNFLGCTHATWLDLRAVKGGEQPSEQEDAYTKLLQEKGLEHEKDYLWRLREAGCSTEEIASSGKLDERIAATRAAMRKGVDIIYQGALTTIPWHGYSDFLRRVDVPSNLGAWSYEVSDTKLARSAKPKHAIQLGVYAELLRHEQGVRPRKVHVLLGDGTEITLSTEDFVHYMGVAVARFETFVNAPPARSVPEPCAHCKYCRWAATCEA
jgi:predicted RecB family nuclease